MKKLDDFINKNYGKYVEVYDPTNKNQCFDLILAWIQELGLGDIVPLGVVHAYQLYSMPTKKIKDNFTLHANTSTAVPRAGDIIVWNSNYGRSGHTAVFMDGDVNNFRVFSQNDPLGTPSLIKKYNYNYVSGWLRPKLEIEPPEPPMPTPQEPKMSDYRLDWKEHFVDEGKDINDAYFDPYRAIDKIMSDQLETQSAGYEIRLSVLKSKNEGLEKEKEDLEDKNETLRNANSELKDKLAEKPVECEDKKYNSLVQAIVDFWNKIKEIKSDVKKKTEK